MRKATRWARLNAGMGTTLSVFSNGSCKRTSALFVRLQPSLRCVDGME